MKLLISEVLQKVSNAKTKAEKIKILQEHNTQTLRSLLIWNFDESVVSMIPSGEVPYTPNEAPAGTEHTVLEHESRLFYHFIKGGNDSLSKVHREGMFIRMLEGLHNDEAHVVCLVKDKQLSKRYKITKNVVAEAYPEIVWGGRS
jgi:hypothetical protein